MDSLNFDILSLIKQKEPDFIAFINNLEEEDAAALLQVSVTPQNKPIVWACVWYALERGVPIKVKPEVERSFILSSTDSSLPDQVTSATDTRNMNTKNACPAPTAVPAPNMFPAPEDHRYTKMQ